jgi:hypothetical protein
MDFYLNNLKLKFREWTDKLQLYNMIERGEIDIDKEADIQRTRVNFSNKIKSSIQTILP